MTLQEKILLSIDFAFMISTCFPSAQPSITILALAAAIHLFKIPDSPDSDVS